MTDNSKNRFEIKLSNYVNVSNWTGKRLVLASAIHEGIGFGIMFGLWGLCYAIRPVSGVLNKFPEFYRSTYENWTLVTRNDMWKAKGISKLLIIIGGFLCYMMADGCTFSIGQLYNEFLLLFHQSQAATAVLPGLVYSVPQIAAPIICPIVDTLGSPLSAVIGGLLLSFSFFVSRFVESLQLMYVTLGFLASMGLELTYVSAIMAVTKGFADGKFMGLALGVTVSGSGIGVFTFNPLLATLISEYTWRGAFIIAAAVFLHILVAAALFRLARTISGKSEYSDASQQPVSQKYQTPNIVIESNSDLNCNTDRSDLQILEPAADTTKAEEPTTVDATAAGDLEAAQWTAARAMDRSSVRVRQPVAAALAGGAAVAGNEERRASVVLALTQSRNCAPFVNPISHQVRASSFDRRINNMAAHGDSHSAHVFIPVDEHSASFVRRVSSLFQSQNIKNSGSSSQISLASSQLREKSDTIYESIGGNKILDKETEMLTPSKNEKSEPGDCGKFQTALVESLLSLFSRKLWINKRFLLFLLQSFFFATSVVVPWTFAYNHCISINLSDIQASLVVSLIGAGSCVGQIAFGLLSDYVPAMTLYCGGCAVCGIVTLGLRWTAQYGWLALLHFVFGLSQGVAYALFSVVIVHYTGMDLYSASLGLYLLMSGCGNLVGTVIGGHLNDVTGALDSAYTVSGSVLLGCAVLGLPLAFLWHREMAATANAVTISSPYLPTTSNVS